MGHALVYVLLRQDPRDTGTDPDTAIIDPMRAYGDVDMTGGRARYMLSEPEAPADTDKIAATWRMSHRQCRLDLQYRLDEAGLGGELGPDIPLERLAELANRTAEYHGERYRVDGDRVVGTSPVPPFPKWDWWQIGGDWSYDFAPPGIIKQVETRTECTLCEGAGELVEKRGLLSRLFGSGGEPAEARTCPRCRGARIVTSISHVGQARDEDLIRTPEDAIRIMDAEDIGGPWAIVDLDGAWHGGEGGTLSGLPEEDDAEAAIKDVVRDILRSAPAGAVVVPVDIHM